MSILLNNDLDFYKFNILNDINNYFGSLDININNLFDYFYNKRKNDNYIIKNSMKLIETNYDECYNIYEINNNAYDFFIGLISDIDRKSTRLNSSHMSESRMPSSA